MKKVYLLVPVIEVSGDEEPISSSAYEQTGVHLVRHPGGAQTLLDVYSTSGENAVFGQKMYPSFIESYDEECLVPKTLYDEVSDSLKMEREALKKQLEEQKAYYESRIKALEERDKEEFDARVAAKVEYIEHEYEIKALKMEQDTPKRFAQGEWVSGKTLKDIIAILTGKGQQP